MTEELENAVEISFHELLLEIGKSAMADKDAYAGFLKQAYSGLGAVMAGHILMHQSDTRYARALFEEGMLLGMTEMRSVFSRCCELNEMPDPYAEPSHNELVATHAFPIGNATEIAEFHHRERIRACMLSWRR